MREALRVSCNTVFGKMSADLGNKKMIAEAEKFGFNNEQIDTPVRAAESVFPKDNRPQNAMAGIGQASTAPPRSRWPWSPRRSPTAAS